MTELQDEMTIAEAAEFLGMAVQTLYGVRRADPGFPKGFRRGRKMKFLRPDIVAWDNAQKAPLRRANQERLEQYTGKRGGK